jgi:hypothetical protein
MLLLRPPLLTLPIRFALEFLANLQVNQNRKGIQVNEGKRRLAILSAPPTLRPGEKETSLFIFGAQ